MNPHYSETDIVSMASSYEGREAIYRDPAHVWRVRLSNVRADHAGLFACVTTLPTPGLGRNVSTWTFGAHWSVLRFSTTYWAASYSDWQVFFAPAVIDRVLHIVASLPAGKTYSDDYVNAGPSKNARWNVRRPGPCALELFTYLNDAAYVS